MANLNSPYSGSHFTALSVGTLGASANYTPGTPVTYWERGTVTVTPASIGAATSGDTTVAVANALLGDTVVMNPPAAALAAGLVVGQCVVSSNGNVRVRIGNLTAGSLTPASGSWSYMLIRS